jgi:Icc protein
MTEVRLDLVRGMLQSAYVIEHARANLQGRWGGDFERDAGRSRERAGRVGRELDARGLRRTDEVIAPHTAWFEAFAGSFPTEVPLGAAVLHQFGKWSDNFAIPFLGEDASDFAGLGREHTRVEAERRGMTEDEAILPPGPLPSGRRFGILTDVHVGSAGRDALARAAVREINEIGPEFVVIPGDFTEDGEPQQFRLAKEIFDGLACPYYAVMGNHDVVQRSTGRPMGAELYAETFGFPPEDFVVDCGGLQVALVDTADPTRSPFADPDASVTAPAGGVDSGALVPGQARALADRLDRRRPVLLVQHHELQPFSGFPPVKFGLREEDSVQELEALKDHQLVGVIAGHTHRSAALGVGDGSVRQLEIPSLKDWPYAYSVAGVSDDGVQVVARQLSDRATIVEMARRLLPMMRRFHIGGAWAQLSYEFGL